MNRAELAVWLRSQYPKEDERHEWKGWRSLKHHATGCERDDAVSYVSALANMEGGTLVIGVEDGTLDVLGITDVHDYTPERLKFRLVERCAGLPSEGLSVVELTASDSGECVWLVHVPKHAPRQPVHAHGRPWQRVGDSLVEIRPERHAAILAEPLVGADWSAAVVPGATLDDLHPAALQKARDQFADKHQRERWAPEIAGWSTEQFLDRAKLAVHGQLTRTALLLLGTPQAAHRLSPHPAQIVWKLPAERALESFAPPFLLNTSEVLRRIRVPMVKLFPATQLLAIELPKYETRIVLEALHNAVAHQDYERCERVVVEEHLERLVFISAGGFVDGAPSDYATGARTPGRYRNKWLADAMHRLGMIDTGGYGIRDMFAEQRKRFLPLPDYERSDAAHVRLEIFGQSIDENYSRLLMERSDLPIEQVVWLDRVQKKQRIDDVQAAQLKRAQLIEGRKPGWFVSAQVADLTDRRAEYTRTKGLDDLHFKKLIVAHVRKFGTATGDELDRFILDKLPDVLTPEQKRHKVKNLRTALRTRGLDGWRLVADRRGIGARWRLEPMQE